MLLQNKYHQKLTEMFNSRNSLRFQIEQSKDFPTEIAKWMGRLKLLYGVPLNYLVPDESMLPPESIRFFYLEPNWIKALLDGAFSIGRSADPEKTTRSFRMDSASTPLISEESKRKASAVRSEYLGLAAQKMDMSVLSGFLLRSSVVADYPGLGVNAYPEGQIPSGADPGTQLTILRMEKLTPAADVLLCIIEGDAYRVDIHEAPEALHYGIDTYINDGHTPGGIKKVYPFTKGGGLGNHSVTMDINHPVSVTLQPGTIFRKDNGGRTICMARLAALIGEKTSPDQTLDASEMGFQMIEGIGMVNFYNEKGRL